MRVQVRYFAALREALGPGEALSWSPDGPSAAEAPATVGQLRAWLSGRSPAHAHLLGEAARGVRSACNQELCPPDHRLQDGDEVAFFPPVTGG
jgi:molybdopterin synthase sulfur carrier subunit